MNKDEMYNKLALYCNELEDTINEQEFIIGQLKDRINRVIYMIENYTTLNEKRIREDMINLLKGEDK